MSSAEAIKSMPEIQPILGYRVPLSLYQEDATFKEVDCCPDYQLDAKNTDIGSMLAYIRHNVPRNTIKSIEAAIDVDSPIRDYSVYYSFFDLPNGRKHFTGVLGATKFQSPIYPDFLEFYQPNSSKSKLFKDVNGHISNRGKRYHIAIDDNNYVSPFEKVSAMSFDMMAAGKVFKSVDRNQINNPEFFLQYLGVLDYLKQNSLCLFHGITYPERFTDFKPDGTYQMMRETTWQTARQFTRIYYQALYGLPFDDFDLSDTLDNVKTTWEVFLDTKPKEYQLKLQEVDHPLIISLAAYQTCMTYPNIETLICLPSGGTQFGFATELAYEYLRPGMKTPDLIPLALSTHAGKKAKGTLLSHDDLVNRLLYLGLEYRNVLVLDDNSNTGETLQLAVDALREVGVDSVNVSLAEVDPLRILYKQTDLNPPDKVVNYWHPDFAHATSITPIVVLPEGRDQQLRKLVARSIVEDY